MPVYIGIIEIIGERLYTGRITWLREYIQNAIDAGASWTEIRLNNGDLEIEDDGGGMDDSELEREAFGLGSSSKTGDQIGELGIGMFAGIGISDHVTVSTKKKGKQAFVATFDVKEYKRLKDNNSRMTFDDAIRQVFKVEEANKPSPQQDDHFTRIRFEHLNKRAIELLERDKVLEFVRDNINVPIHKAFPWKERIEEFLGNDQKQIVVRLKVGKVTYEPKRFENVKEDLNDPIMMPIGESGKDPIARLWACYSKMGRSFAGQGAGILVKFKGMTVGDRTVVGSRFQAKDDSRFLGEMVILRSSNLAINTERTWFADSDGLEALVKHGKAALQELHNFANLDSSMGNNVSRLIKKQANIVADIRKETAKDNRGTVNELKQEYTEVTNKIERKLGVRESKLSELKEAVKTDSSPVKKAALDFLSAQSIPKPVALPKEELRERKKRDMLQYIRTLQDNYVIDPRLVAKTKKKNMKDTTNNVFTFLETCMKAKLGIPEKDFVDFKALLARFMRLYKDPNEPNDPKQKKRYYKAFNGFMSSIHVILRNPSAHTFMDEQDTGRSIMQVLFIGDFALSWLDSWSLKSPPRGKASP